MRYTRTTPRIPAAYRAKHLSEPDGRKRGYTWNYQKARNVVMAEEPLCRDCHDQGVCTPAEEIHHPKKVKDRPDLVVDRENMVPLCCACHAVRTARGE